MLHWELSDAIGQSPNSQTMMIDILFSQQSSKVPPPWELSCRALFPFPELRNHYGMQDRYWKLIFAEGCRQGMIQHNTYGFAGIMYRLMMFPPLVLGISLATDPM